MQGHIFLLIGPSGAGKNTLINALLKKYPELTYIPSFTTRPMRTGESQENPYHFVSREDFVQRINNNEFFEHQNVHGNLYGTSQNEFQKTLNNGQIGVTDVDIIGGLKIKHAWPESITTIFVRPSDPQTLIERLKDRNTESPKDIERRLQRISLEMNMEKQCEFTVINDDLDLAVKSLSDIVSQHRNGYPLGTIPDSKSEPSKDASVSQ